MASTTLVPLAPGSDIAKELTTSMYTVLVTAAKNAAASAKDDDTGAGGGAGGGAGAGASGAAAALTKEAVTSFYDACRKAVQRSDYLTFVNEVLKHVETLFDHPDEKGKPPRECVLDFGDREADCFSPSFNNRGGRSV